MITQPTPISNFFPITAITEQPHTYDESPQPRQHITMIVDDVVEVIASAFGLAALGLYTLMERRANKFGYAFGSYQDWADMAGMTRRHIIRLMDQLVSGGWVTKIEQSSANGMSRPNAWLLPNHQTPESQAQQVRTDGGDTTSDTTSDTGGDMALGVYVTPKVAISSSKVSAKVKNQKSPEYNGATNGHGADPVSFDSWYDLYPRHIARGAAEKAWSKLTPEQQALSVVAITNQRSWPSMASENKFVPHPATWLNGKQWMDEPPPRSERRRGVAL